jgi:RHS repeat-associated protein
MILARDIHKPDAFGRMTAVKTRGGSPATVSEYRYNGLGHRIGWRSDTNHDSTVDGSDPWYWFAYDDRWRVVATYRGSDAHPKERFIHHNAGPAGFGGSSYIDSLILRDSDDPEGWTNAADGTLETRHYYLQNWRHDVVALIEPDGTPFEYIRYSAYGVPTVYAAGDVNRDGVCDGFDPQDWDDYNDFGIGAMAVDLDVNRDGVVGSADRALVQGHADWALWTSHGRGSVSRLHNRRGYAGYEYDPATAQWHVRHRVLVSEMGRWNRRDPLGYVDGMSVYEYVGSRAVVATDPSGLVTFCDNSRGGTCGISVWQNPEVGGHRWIELGDGTGVGYYPSGNGSCWMTPDPIPEYTDQSRNIRHCKSKTGDPATGKRPADNHTVLRNNCKYLLFEREMDRSGGGCQSRTCGQIISCLKHYIPKIKWSLCTYNCRDAVDDALESCCLHKSNLSGPPDVSKWR